MLARTIYALQIMPAKLEGRYLNGAFFARFAGAISLNFDDFGALAATQWKCGRLEPRVSDKALAIISSGANLTRWRDAGPKELKSRVEVLDRLRAKLLSPQPPVGRIPKPFVDTCDWEVGELISYRLLSGNIVLFRVVGYHTDKGGTSPICELLDEDLMEHYELE